jgi:diguanylate cyclase (GGDEF)-like protein
VSPDAIVDAIVEDLGVATGADHTVVVRLRADARILEATLVSSRAGVPSSTTMLPLSDLDDPGSSPRARRGLRASIAIPILTDTARQRVVSGGGRPAVQDWGMTAPARSAQGVDAGAEASAELTTHSAEPVDDAMATRVAQRLAERVGSVYGLKNTLAAPLVTGQGVVGAIVLSRRLSDAWSTAAERFVHGAAVEASAALARAYSYREAEAAASTDALTGLPNRRYFDEFCGLLARRRRSDDAIGVLMIDIDHFKLLNDQFGHPAGDQVLRAVATTIATAVREGDVPARYGGEEFAVLLRNPGPGIAAEVGERVRSSVADLDLSAFGPTGVTVSIGVAVSHAEDQPISQLVDEADNALYRAKRLGRNQVVAA